MGKRGGRNDHVKQRECLAFLAVGEPEHAGVARNRICNRIGLNAAQEAVGISGFVRAHSCVDLANIDGGGCESVPLLDQVREEMTPVTTVA